MSGWLPALWISPSTVSGALGKREADRPDPRVVAPEVSGSRGDRAWGWVQGSGWLASWSRCSLALPKVIAPDTQDDGWHGRQPGCGSLWLDPVPHPHPLIPCPASTGGGRRALTRRSLQDARAAGEHPRRRPEQPRRRPGLPAAAQGLLHGHLGLPVLPGHRLLPVFPAEGQAWLPGSPPPPPTTPLEGVELESR